ncbi:lytic transglycosylase domain-containing protein [Roseiarcus sp.]|uniref:lytic transglycosylase domain-containing protein n=1 Tax=Roseiarcus sp. TaxID=1969460 RepID=UPI003C787874
MRIESGGDLRAVSPKGAMGLTQIMPKTYAGLRTRHHLGPDAYNPRDSILAGAAYLREMLDRYGSSGFLAAYNAGPARYDEHLATGRPLPPETQVYIAMLSPVIGDRQSDNRTVASFDLIAGLARRCSPRTRRPRRTPNWLLRMCSRIVRLASAASSISRRSLRSQRVSSCISPAGIVPNEQNRIPCALAGFVARSSIGLSQWGGAEHGLPA